MNPYGSGFYKCGKSIGGTMAKKKAAAELNLSKELAALASHIGKALKAAKDSAELRGIKEETLSGLRATGSRIVIALEKAKESDSLQDIKTQAKKVYDIGKIRTKHTVGNAGENLAIGLRHIGKELEALAERLIKK